eukprot:292563_1
MQYFRTMQQTAHIPDIDARIRLQNKFKGKTLQLSIQSELMRKLKPSQNIKKPKLKMNIHIKKPICDIHYKIRSLICAFVENNCSDLILSSINHFFEYTDNSRYILSDNNHRMTVMCTKYSWHAPTVYCKYNVVCEPKEAFIVKWNIINYQQYPADEISIVVSGNGKAYSYRSDGKIETATVGYLRRKIGSKIEL